MSSSHGKKLLGGAAAVAMIGCLTNVAPAQAYPPAPLAPVCSSYQFPAGTVTLNYPKIGRTVFNLAVPSPHVDTAATTFYDNGTSLDGSATGDISGNKVHLTVTREGYPPLVLNGAVDAGNRAHGTVVFRKSDPAAPWDSSEEFSCTASTPADQGAPSQNGFVVGGPVGIYNIAADENGDVHGHVGMRIGTLEDGQLVIIAPGGPCAKDSWCKIVMPGDPDHVGFVNGHIQF
jgi:hypothetical protein